MTLFGSKTRLPGQIVEKSYVRSLGHILLPVVLKVGHNVRLDDMIIFRLSLEMDNVESEPRSLPEIIDKFMVVSKGV